jgi:excisionase family DNA binding protein
VGEGGEVGQRGERGELEERGGAGEADDLIDLQQAAERLGVHYMTAYRYVRLGRLPATKVAGQWTVPVAALAALATGRDVGPAGGRRGRPRLDVHRSRLLDRLLAGDEAGAWSVVEAARASGVEPVALHLDLLAPVLRSVGDRWAIGELTVGDEHKASAVATRLVGRLGPLMARPGRRRGRVVVGAAPGDAHGLPASILANVLRGAQYEVVELGASTPAGSFVEALGEGDAPLAACVSASVSGHDAALRRVVDALHRVSAVPVLVGGAAVAGPAHARDLGADGTAADGRGALHLVQELWAARRKEREHPGAGDGSGPRRAGGPSGPARPAGPSAPG